MQRMNEVWVLIYLSHITDWESINQGVYVFSSAENAMRYVEEKYGKHEWEPDYYGETLEGYVAKTDFKAHFSDYRVDMLSIDREIVDDFLVCLEEEDNAKQG